MKYCWDNPHYLSLTVVPGLGSRCSVWHGSVKEWRCVNVLFRGFQPETSALFLTSGWVLKKPPVSAAAHTLPANSGLDVYAGYFIFVKTKDSDLACNLNVICLVLLLQETFFYLRYWHLGGEFELIFFLQFSTGLSVKCCLWCILNSAFQISEAMYVENLDKWLFFSLCLFHWKIVSTAHPSKKIGYLHFKTSLFIGTF